MVSKRVLRNTLLLTGVSLLMSGVGMAFQSWLAIRLGASALGLYSLTLSVRRSRSPASASPRRA